ncbi:D-alanine--D-alanine ligase [Kosmotoga arenicorallina S304]|uniref:D-alanine--D-alanine ligase n=1 Tax=Kosmotoga arenicorallina S304 TaxID=1453497 RepID=A0A176K135_9BACT|nr:ATP-grasp domain-containing protein [Kosmotoga arenicorallina]OAA30720.1 D-alanine--D-alanine ligase [Kosmotoga arenicorallina S304]
MKVAVVYDEPLAFEKKDMVFAVCKALSSLYNAKPLPFNEKFLSNVRSFDFVFNLSTGGGKYNKQVHVPAVLDVLGIPFTGSSAGVHAICMDKGLTKLILQKNNIPTPPFTVITNPSEITDPGFYPAFVKPSREGSAEGVSEKSVVKNFIELKERVISLYEAFREPILVEEFIDGREFTVGIVGNGEQAKVLPILEIDFSQLPEGLERFYSHRVKHNYAEKTRYICPARLEAEQVKELENLALRTYKALRMFDYARIDVRMNDNGFHIIEANSLPLLVPVYSDLTKMLEPIGWNYDDLVLNIFKAAKIRQKLLHNLE